MQVEPSPSLSGTRYVPGVGLCALGLDGYVRTDDGRTVALVTPRRVCPVAALGAVERIRLRAAFAFRGVA